MIRDASAIRRLESLANRVDLQLLPDEWSMRLTVDDRGLHVHWKCQNRSHKDEWMDIDMTFTPPACMSSTSDRHLMDWIRMCLREAVCHELDEAILLDGKRVYDPHRNEARNAEAAA